MHQPAENKQQRILVLSRVVWEQVVVPWVLRPAVARRKWARELPRPATSCVLATAEAMFPLVALASRALPSSLSSGTGLHGSRHYRTVENAAMALSPRCVAWMISNRTTLACWDYGDGVGSGSRRKAKEQIAVLRGLCMGGHLVMAQRFVDYGCECWPVEVAEEGPRKGSVRFWPLAQADTVMPDTGSVGGADSVVDVALLPSKKSTLEQGTELGDEFWSERGLWSIMYGVCKYGHLDVLKWLLSISCLQVNEGTKSLMQGFMHLASFNGHCHMLPWLLDTYDIEAPKNIVLTHKNAVSDLKCLLEKRPDLHLIQFALSDVTDKDTLSDTWSNSCSDCGDVGLGKWFIEEKGVTPTPHDVIGACSGRHDNAAFVEWLFKKVGDSLTSDQLLECLHRALANQSRNSIALWLEQLLMTSTGRMPKISLSKLVEYHNDPRDTWLEWVLAHSSYCVIECSPTEAANVIDSIVAKLAGSLKVDVAISIWKKFSLSPVLNHDVLFKLLRVTVMYGTFFQFKDVASLGDFSLDELQQCMRIKGRYFQSSKIVKLLVNEAMRKAGTSTPITCNFPGVHGIFSGLVFNNKRSAAQWLFNMFRISLKDVLFYFDNTPIGLRVYLATWKMVLGMFPGITGDVIRQGHCVEMALKTPLNAQFTMSKLGLTLYNVEALCNNTKYSLCETANWLTHQAKPPHDSTTE